MQCYQYKAKQTTWSKQANIFEHLCCTAFELNTFSLPLTRPHHNRIQVGSVNQIVDINAAHQGVHINSIQLVVPVHPLQGRIQVYPLHHAVPVYSAAEVVHIDGLYDGVDDPLAQEAVHGRHK
jgi:hypothetical protein